MEEFYPESAKSAAQEDEPHPLDHSIRKWEGLLPKNLKKHGMKRGREWVYKRKPGKFIQELEGEEAVFFIDNESCSLCMKYHLCEGCPLFEELGYPCDSRDGGPYISWLEKNSVLPMLNKLKAARRKIND
jgi:hypothetical protein